MTRQEFKEKCISLRKQDFTITEIVKILNKPKSSIHFHVKNIPPTSKLLQKIREKSVNHLHKIRPNLKGISWKKRYCRGFTTWTTDLVNLVAHIIFDGELKTTAVFYNNRSQKLITDFENNMKILYDFKPKVYIKPGEVIRLAYYSVELADFIRTKRDRLLNNITLFEKDYQRSFLKAFFDDEGCISFLNRKRIVRGYQYNNNILYLVQKLLENFKIESKVDARFNEIIISRRENLEKFAKEINFSPGVRVNGKRSNSIWKKSLEKRQILNMALSSYI